MPLIEYKDRRQLPDEEATAIFDHMTKTGGSTLAGVLIPHYDAQSILVLSGQALHTQYDGIANRAHSFQFIHGHGTRGAHTLFPEWKKVFYLTLLRHPLKQWMSNYKKMVSRTYPGENPEYLSKKLEYYVYNSPENNIVKWFGNGDPALAEQTVFERYAFFGITEFLAESIYALGEILPCLRKEKLIYNTAVSPMDDVTIGKAAEEYFMEKNFLDMELYDKAVKEFKKRTAAQVSDIELATNEKSYYSDNEIHTRNASIAMDLLRQAKPVTDSLLYNVFAILGNSDEQWEKFYYYLQKYNLPQHKFFEFACSARLGKTKEMDACGCSLFDIIDRVDGGNRVTALVHFRLDILRRFINSRSDSEKGEFFERCCNFLSSLRETPEWRVLALNNETILFEKYGEFDAALASARIAVEMVPGSFEFHENLCRLLLKTKAIVEAEEEARKELFRNPNSEWALRQLIRVLLIKGEQPEAEIHLRNVLTENPCWPEGQQVFLNLLIAKGLFAEAEIVERKYRTYCPNNSTHLNIAKSRILESRGEIDAAITEIRVAINNGSPGAAIHEALTSLLIRRNRIAEAEKEARESAKMFPGLVWPLLQLSQICEARGDSISGLEYARKAYALRSGLWAIAANLARFLRLAGNHDELEDFCKNAIEKNPNQGWAWRELCRLAETQGNRKLALEMGSKAIAVHPADNEFRLYYNDLASSKTT